MTISQYGTMSGSALSEVWNVSFQETWDRRHYLQPQNAPLYPLLLNLVTKFYKFNEFLSLRIISVMLGCLSFFVMLMVSKLYMKREHERLLFLCIVAISSFHIQFSQVVRFSYIIIQSFLA